METLTPVPSLAMTDGILGKAATMEIPIHGNGEAGQLPEDDGLEQVLLFDFSPYCLGLGIPTHKPWALILLRLPSLTYLTPFSLFTNLHSDSMQTSLVCSL